MHQYAGSCFFAATVSRSGVSHWLVPTLQRGNHRYHIIRRSCAAVWIHIFTHTVCAGRVYYVCTCVKRFCVLCTFSLTPIIKAYKKYFPLPNTGQQQEDPNLKIIRKI